MNLQTQVAADRLADRLEQEVPTAGGVMMSGDPVQGLRRKDASLGRYGWTGRARPATCRKSTPGAGPRRHAAADHHLERELGSAAPGRAGAPRSRGCPGRALPAGNQGQERAVPVRRASRLRLPSSHPARPGRLSRRRHLLQVAARRRDAARLVQQGRLPSPHGPAAGRDRAAQPVHPGRRRSAGSGAQSEVPPQAGDAGRAFVVVPAGVRARAAGAAGRRPQRRAAAERLWNHRLLLKVVSHTPVEVRALARLQASHRWIDAVRHFVPPTERLFSWWSYRARDWSASRSWPSARPRLRVTPCLVRRLRGASTLRARRGAGRTLRSRAGHRRSAARVSGSAATEIVCSPRRKPVMSSILPAVGVDPDEQPPSVAIFWALPDGSRCGGRSYNRTKGFGFVKPNDGAPDAFLHASLVAQAGHEDLVDGTSMVCDIADGRAAAGRGDSQHRAPDRGDAAQPPAPVRGCRKPGRGHRQVLQCREGLRLHRARRRQQDVFVSARTLTRAGIAALEAERRVGSPPGWAKRGRWRRGSSCSSRRPDE